MLPRSPSASLRPCAKIASSCCGSDGDSSVHTTRSTVDRASERSFWVQAPRNPAQRMSRNCGPRLQDGVGAPSTKYNTCHKQRSFFVGPWKLRKRMDATRDSDFLHEQWIRIGTSQRKQQRPSTTSGSVEPNEAQEHRHGLLLWRAFLERWNRLFHGWERSTRENFP